MTEQSQAPEVSGLTDIHILKLTPDNIGDLLDGRIQDALLLILKGIWESKKFNGQKFTENNQHEYLSLENYWQEVMEMEGDRHPFLLIAWNIKDGVVGALEARKYKYSGTNEPAIFTNWVVVRDTGSSDDDESSYRGNPEKGRKGVVADKLYEEIEKIAEEENRKLLIAGVHQDNQQSIGFHKRRGFVNVANPGESTEGEYIEPFPITEEDKFGRKTYFGDIIFYTKRLRSTS